MLDESVKVNKKAEEPKDHTSEQQQLSWEAQKDLLSLQVCNRDHDFKFTYQWARNHGSTRFGCDKCKKLGDKPSWHCVPCKFDLCSACRLFEASQRKCPNNHELTTSVYCFYPRCNVCLDVISNFYPRCCVCITLMCVKSASICLLR